MTRTPQETFPEYVRALDSGDLDAIAANFTPDAVFVTPDGVLHGRDGVKQGIGAVLADLPHARWNPKAPLFVGDVLFLEWAATASEARVEDGVDTFVFRDGLIRAQTVRYTLLTGPAA
jgi:ketosteroid isomerase-like protein